MARKARKCQAEVGKTEHSEKNATFQEKIDHFKLLQGARMAREAGPGLTSESIVAVVKACGEAGARKIELPGLIVEFYAKSSWSGASFTDKPATDFMHRPGPGGAGVLPALEATPEQRAKLAKIQAEYEALSRMEAELDELRLTNPEEYERRIAEGELLPRPEESPLPL
jgi:hypothetical protein